jgi:hypothetical protein
MKLPNIIFGRIKDGNTEDSVQFAVLSPTVFSLKKIKNVYSKILIFSNKHFFIYQIL